jgi:L-iditol 2-dehydrogenase
MTSPGAIEIHEVPRPAPAKGELLLRVRRIGVCGSDIHVYHGLHPYTSYPVVQGHEVSALVEELGPGVEGFTLGESVTFMPQITCGTCYPCTHGMYNICDSLKVMGFQAPGAGQYFFAVDASKIIRLPPSLSPEAGAMIEPLAVAAHALRRGGDVTGKKVAIVGAGPIGNLVTQMAIALGARDTLVMDKSAYRLGIAKQCGAGHTLEAGASDSDLDSAIRSAFGPDRADLILECVGAEATMSQAVSAARKGSTVVVVGVFGKKPVVDLGLVQDRELSLVGTLMYQKEDYEQAVALAASGRIALDSLVTNSFPFEKYLEAYHFIDKAGDHVMKVMIALD